MSGQNAGDGSSQSQKPSPSSPLFLHATGQWAKKIRGRTHYFGRDREAALAKYDAQKEDLHRGRIPKDQKDELTLRGLCNAFLTSKLNKMRSGELSERTFADYHACARRLLRAIGKGRAVADIDGSDFEKFRAKLAVNLGPVALANEIQRVRTIFKYAFDNKLADKPTHFGDSFSKPSRKVLRQAREAKGSRMIEAIDLRKILDESPQPLKSWVLLAVNCGFGQSDIAALPLSAIDADKAWIDFPRPKTAAKRRCPLWPETVAALREALPHRPKAARKDFEQLAFLSPRGLPVVRLDLQVKQGKAVRIDAVLAAWNKLLVRLDMKRDGHGFYSLRHIFFTIGEESKDKPAVDRIMGHIDPSISNEYRERVGDDRLLAVSEFVRAWLWPKNTAK
jgi:integrase